MNTRIRLHDLEFEPYLSENDIQTRVRQLGATLSEQYVGRNPLFISILSGAFMFAADLIRHFEGDCEIAFVKLRSYAGTQSSGQVQSIIGLEMDLAGRPIVIVEDIVDTGRTLHFFMEQLRLEQPESVKVVTLLHKPEASTFPVPLDLVGFEIENKFVVGYGLDYEGLGRNLPAIYQLANT
ncbi:MAG TPA: hypoxanthine phosphoribosyltransferase [Saprospiraceae bacterium]|nr:hypoxanthine phosphoribosyltransferase [Saprospiraceae bacterium]HNM24020.1 hypoxanthine phosphoribosyltransferase [Saprospiraceae bacterium]